MRRLILAGMVAIMMALVIGCSSSPTAIPEVGPQIGAMAPDFTLSTLGDNVITLSELQGKPVLLNFWATWCGPCRQEMPYFQELFEDSARLEHLIVAVNIGEDESTVRKFITNRGYTFPVALDQEKHVALEYNIAGIPTTFLIDRAGVIQSKKVGAFASRPDLVAWMKNRE